MTTKSGITSLFLGDRKIAETKTDTLNIPEQPLNKAGARMQFYYRRGNKYFFRGLGFKVMVETPALKDMLKRGEYYKAEWEVKNN